MTRYFLGKEGHYLREELDFMQLEKIESMLGVSS